MMNLRASLALIVASVCVATAAVKECYPACGGNAFCDDSQEYAECRCNSGFFGVPFSGNSCTTSPACRGDTECPSDEVCGRHNECVSPCHTSCPADIGCVVTNHVAECQYDGPSIAKPHP